MVRTELQAGGRLPYSSSRHPLTYSLRWIFIVEGSITGGHGVLSFFFMSAYPATAPWLSESERNLVVLVNEADRALKAKEAFSGSQIRSAFTDWRTYCWATMFITTYIPVYSVVLSLPTVIAGLGYKGTIATLLACPPYGVGFIAVLSVGFSIDRYGLRYWHYVGSILVAVAALIVLMIVEKFAVRYAMFFFVMFM